MLVFFSPAAGGAPWEVATEARVRTNVGRREAEARSAVRERREADMVVDNKKLDIYRGL